MTALFTSLTADDDNPEGTDVGISSFMDTWLVLRNIEANGERNRMLNVLKSRGMPHSNQLREFVLTRRGLQLLDRGARCARPRADGSRAGGPRRQRRCGATAPRIATRGRR